MALERLQYEVLDKACLAGPGRPLDEQDVGSAKGRLEGLELVGVLEAVLGVDRRGRPAR